MWRASSLVAVGLTLLAAASAQTTVSDYCDQQGQGRRLQFGGLGGLLGGGDDEPEAEPVQVDGCGCEEGYGWVGAGSTGTCVRFASTSAAAEAECAKDGCGCVTDDGQGWSSSSCTCTDGETTTADEEVMCRLGTCTGDLVSGAVDGVVGGLGLPSGAEPAVEPDADAGDSTSSSTRGSSSQEVSEFSLGSYSCGTKVDADSSCADGLEDTFPALCPALAAAGYCRGMYPSYGGCMKVSLRFVPPVNYANGDPGVWCRAAKSVGARPDCFYSARCSSSWC